MSFTETFTRKQRKNVLDYDDSAFLYFLFTILSMTFIIWLIIFLWRIFMPKATFTKRILSTYYQNKEAEEINQTCTQEENDRMIMKSNEPTLCSDYFQQCYCEQCIERLKNKLYVETSYKNILGSWKKQSQIFTLLTLLFFIVFLYSKILYLSELQMFNPYDLLNIPSNSDEKKIKKAYRTLSLKLHPDKNPNDPTANAKFIMINKAYQTLTEETARKNYELYGNPDGPGFMELGIGLPHFLIDEENQDVCLLFLLLFFVFSIPLGFIVYHEKQKNFDPSGIRIDTIHFFAYCLTSTASTNTIVEFLAASAEARELPEDEADEALLKELAPRLHGIKKRQLNSEIVHKNTLTIFAHMYRLHDKLSDKTKKNLLQLLNLSMPMTKSMMDIAILHNWLNVLFSIIKVRRSLVQAVFPAASPFVQLPHYLLIKKKVQNLEFQEFVDMTSEKKSTFLSLSDPKILRDIEAFCSSLPKVKCKCHAYVKGESEIIEGDIVTVKISITRRPTQNTLLMGYVHAPLFPELKIEELWVFLTEKQRSLIIGYSHHKTVENIIESKIEFLAPPSGTYKFTVVIMSDSYLGVDIEEHITIKVSPKSTAKRSIFVHPEDMELEKDVFSLSNLIGNEPSSQESEEESDTNI